MSDTFCYKCEAKKKISTHRYAFMQQQCKQRAVENQKLYCLYYDDELDEIKIGEYNEHTKSNTIEIYTQH